MKKTLKTILTILAVLAAIAGICAAAYVIYKKYFAEEDIDFDAEGEDAAEETVITGKRNYVSLKPKKEAEEAE